MSLLVVYWIQYRARGDFQIEEVSDELCRPFSNRRAEIDQAMATLLVEKPERARGDVIGTNFGSKKRVVAIRPTL
jgi:hypothetical protein